MYEIVFVDKAKKQFKKLNKILQLRIIKVLERVKIRPHAHFIRLIGDPGFKLRAGNHRILVDIKEDKLIILVLKIGHRRNIYSR